MLRMLLGGWSLSFMKIIVVLKTRWLEFEFLEDHSSIENVENFGKKKQANRKPLGQVNFPLSLHST